MVCSHNTFPNLQILRLIDFPQPEEWQAEDRAFPSLKSFQKTDCEKLKRIPVQLERFWIEHPELILKYSECGYSALGKCAFYDFLLNVVNIHFYYTILYLSLQNLINHPIIVLVMLLEGCTR